MNGEVNAGRYLKMIKYASRSGISPWSARWLEGDCCFAKHVWTRTILAAAPCFSFNGEPVMLAGLQHNQEEGEDTKSIWGFVFFSLPPLQEESSGLLPRQCNATQRGNWEKSAPKGLCWLISGRLKVEGGEANREKFLALAKGAVALNLLGCKVLS